MTQTKVPKHLQRILIGTGYGYISTDYLYRVFRYKYKGTYCMREPQRWLLLRPDSKTEYFETLLDVRKRIYKLQQESAVRKEKKRLLKQVKERAKERTEERGKKNK